MKRAWTSAESALLASMYPDCHAEDCAAWLGRTVSSVYQAAIKARLRKSADYLASDTACRIQRGKQSPQMIATRFQKGQAAWNKGRKGVNGFSCTRFQPGRKPEESRNYQPIGSLRLTRDGYLERKVTDDQSIYPARRWVAVHRLVWEAEKGSIPPGHIVRFREGMKTTVAEEVTVDRLECITRADNAQRNHPRSRDPELARLIQLKGAITRQVNRIAREAQEHA